MKTEFCVKSDTLEKCLAQTLTLTLYSIIYLFFKSQMFFSDLTKNLNWEILTKDLVLLKNEMCLRMKNIKIVGVYLKIKFLGGMSS